MLVHLLVEGSRPNRWCPACGRSRIIFLVLESHRELATLSREAGGQQSKAINVMSLDGISIGRDFGGDFNVTS